MDALKEERVRLGITQESLATLCNVTRKTVVNWESGRPIPSDKLALLKQHGFDVVFVIDGTRSTFDEKSTEEINMAELEDTLELMQKQIGEALVWVKRVRRVR